MAAKKGPALPFDKRGGKLVNSRHMIESNQYLSLSAQAKVLITLMHVHWRNDRPVAYGVREAMEKIPCAKRTAQNAFKELERRGFIVLVDESLFNSRTQSKSRTWRLTWLPYKDRFPTNDWERINSIGSKTHPVAQPQGQICTR